MIARIIMGQVNRGEYFFISSGNEIHGYCGWMRTSTILADKWLEGTSNTDVLPIENESACIINMWKAQSPLVNAAILETLKDRSGGVTHFFGKRFYPNGRIRKFRIPAPTESNGRIPSTLLGLGSRTSKIV
jgi:hypothetical protein